MTKRKFKPGRKVKNMGELSYLLARGSWVYVRHKAYHPGWLMANTWRYLFEAVRCGWVRRVEKA